MNTKIDELLSKYWDGETSLEEEKELKTLLLDADGFEQEKTYFGILQEYKRVNPEKLPFPLSGKSIRSFQIRWIGWAASLILLISSVWIWRDYEQKKEQELAYQEVMEALALIQTNLAKGQSQMQPLNDLKYLNTTQQLFSTNP